MCEEEAGGWSRFLHTPNNQQQKQVMALLLSNDNNADTAGALFSS